jgi:Iron/zinc purple acid phosphatase-like protein C
VHHTPQGDVHTFQNPRATVHMVIGTAGAGFTENAQTPRPEWNEMFFYKWGYARVVAHNSTYLTWEWVESSSGTVFDRMAISQITDFKQNPYWPVPSDVEDDWFLPGGEKDSKEAKSFITTVANFFLYGYGFLVVAVLFILSVLGIVFAFFPTSTLTAADTPGSSSPSWRPWTAFQTTTSRGHDTYTAVQTGTAAQSEGEMETEGEMESGRERETGRERERGTGAVQVTQNPLNSTSVEGKLQTEEEKMCFECTDKRPNKRTDKRTEKRTDKRTEKRTNRCTESCTDKCKVKGIVMGRVCI